jgi:hypothetical protein
MDCRNPVKNYAKNTSLKERNAPPLMGSCAPSGDGRPLVTFRQKKEKETKKQTHKKTKKNKKTEKTKKQRK